MREGKVWIIGAGPGDPELLTLRAARALAQADAAVVDHLVNPALLAHLRQGAEIVFAGKEGGKPCIDQLSINRMLIARAREGLVVARLKGGDPFVFGRGAEEAEALTRARIPWELVPGISAGIAAPAYAGIPLLHRDHASSVAFLTGHRGSFSADLAKAADTLVIFMCASTIVEIAQKLLAAGRRPTTPAAVIHQGTLSQQEVRTGTLAELAACPAPPLPPPALAVIGAVAALSEGLRWFGGAPQPFTGPPRSPPPPGTPSRHVRPRLWMRQATPQEGP